MSDYKLYLRDIAKRPSPTGEWLHGGPKITFENLKKGDGPVEHFPRSEAMEQGGGRGPSQEYRGWQPIGKAKAAGSANGGAEGPVMTFGKHKSKPMKWVKENDSSYWDWALENVPFFQAQVDKAGL